jgi:hypothetical protein
MVIMALFLGSHTAIMAHTYQVNFVISSESERRDKTNHPDCNQGTRYNECTSPSQNHEPMTTIVTVSDLPTPLVRRWAMTATKHERDPKDRSPLTRHNTLERGNELLDKWSLRACLLDWYFRSALRVIGSPAPGLTTCFSKRRSVNSLT